MRKPRYITAAELGGVTVRYKWDEWNVKEAYLPAHQELLERLIPLTRRANIALTIATAEWIAYRFELLDPDPMPLQYLEAAWAANIDLAYARYIETDDDQWRGPVRGPLNVALMLVIDGLFLEDENPNPAVNAAWITNLANRVLENTDSFRMWREAAIDRLDAYYRASATSGEDLFGDEGIKGPLVPREVFDPQFPFTPDLTAELIRSFLSELDVRANPFLRTPEAMRELGFKGRPYSFGS